MQVKFKANREASNYLLSNINFMAVNDWSKAGYTGYLSEAMGKECISFCQRRISQLGRLVLL